MSALIQSGPYAGQRFAFVGRSKFPRWWIVKLEHEEEGFICDIEREIPEKCLTGERT